jgi:hypothetical protein
MRSLLTWFGAVVLTCLALPSPAAEPAFVATMSRGVKVFSQLELKLGAAAHARDRDALDALLDENFELRRGAEPGRPLPRAEWNEQVTAHAPEEIEISQMAVHDLGTHAVVSFVSAPKGAANAGREFIVDVWRKSGDDWRLLVRYASPSSAQDDAAPTGRN